MATHRERLRHHRQGIENTSVFSHEHPFLNKRRKMGRCVHAHSTPGSLSEQTAARTVAPENALWKEKQDTSTSREESQSAVPRPEARGRSAWCGKCRPPSSVARGVRMSLRQLRIERSPGRDEDVCAYRGPAQRRFGVRLGTARGSLAK